MLGQKYFYSMSLFDALFILSIISVVFSLQMFVSDHGWSCIPVTVKPDPGELISTHDYWSLKRALQRKDITKRVLKFVDYCNFCGVPLVPPFPVTFLVAYPFKVDKSSILAYSDMAHATLKWFHLFGLSNGLICWIVLFFIFCWRLLGVISQLVSKGAYICWDYQECNW